MGKEESKRKRIQLYKTSTMCQVLSIVSLFSGLHNTLENMQYCSHFIEGECEVPRSKLLQNAASKWGNRT